MNIEQELEEAKKKRVETINEINAIEQQRQRLEEQKQQLLQEVLRLDGDIRTLDRLAKSGTESAKKAS